jgi:alkaline phosphatase D
MTGTSIRDWTRRGALGAALSVSAACSAPDIETPPYEGAVSFAHGVASGDPQGDRVIIWTRVTADRAGAVPVRWIVARNRALTDVVKTGIVEANAGRDYTVKVDVTGLRPGAPYFYGFRAGEAQSAIGKTRTLPNGVVDEAKLAVVSCASFPHGYFNVYDALAQRDDIDLVIHLGDYIYEYGLTGYGGETALRLARIPEPEIECLRLDDYRARHAQYKTEPELQAAHAAAPWIVVWDDHEIANDCFVSGAENHQRSEGEWAARKRAALQAYYEWMPIREPEPGRAFEAINRSFAWGDLFKLVMLETRLLARTEPLDYAASLPLQQQRWNIANPERPIALRPYEADTAHMRLLPAIYEAVGDELRPVYDWARAQGLAAVAPDLPDGFFLAPDPAALDALLRAPERALLGDAQEQWLASELRTQAVWRVIGNQVLVAPVACPDLSETPEALANALERQRPGVSQLLKLSRFAFPLSTDTWDGYPACRERLYRAMREAGGALVLTGDSHGAWLNELGDEAGRVGVELGTTSVTSPSEADYFTPAGIDFAAGVMARNAHVKHADLIHRGFLVVTLTRDNAIAEYFAVSTVLSKDYETERRAAFTIAPDSTIARAP